MVGAATSAPKAKAKTSQNTIILKGVIGEKLYYEYLNVASRPQNPIDFGGGEELHQTILDLPLEEGAIGTASASHIAKLAHDRSKKAVWFLDTHKTRTKYWVNMIDVTNSEAPGVIGGVIGALPVKTSKPCWNCRNTFKWRPAGCPLKYHPHRQTTTLERQHLEQKFRNTAASITEAETHSTTVPKSKTSVPKSKASTKQKIKVEKVQPVARYDFFETEGLFCSAPCVKNYIIEQGLNSRYKESLTLLTLMWMKITGRCISIPRAPTWKVLIEYGGHLTIDEYRATFGLLLYIETVSAQRPYMFCSSKYIEERRMRL